MQVVNMHDSIARTAFFFLPYLIIPAVYGDIKE